MGTSTLCAPGSAEDQPASDFGQAAIAKKHDLQSASPIGSSFAPRGEGGVAEVSGVEEFGKDPVAEEVRLEETKVGQEVEDEETRKP